MFEIHFTPDMTQGEKVNLVDEAMESHDQILLVEDMSHAAILAAYTNYLMLLNRSDLFGATYDLKSLEFEGKLKVYVVITNKKE